jgi:hypothetical protein
MMMPSQSENAFRERLGQPLEAITARRALGAMLAFYAEERAEDVAIDEDGDMLLCEWGVYCFTSPESFQFGITRQFFVRDEDEPFQLKLILHFPPVESLRQLGEGNKWCHSPKKAPAFGNWAESSAAFSAIADARPSRVELFFEQC